MRTSTPTPRDKALEAALLAEVEAKRARISMLACLLDQPRPLSYVARGLLELEAQPLAGRPGFRDEWRLT